mmetsp:Transcript_109286/g.319929  ORF Transcript_109286/g.319929 Transcript_109286/m.319929 type:complete len:82 (-) Transcript_109286:500-745(-)
MRGFAMIPQTSAMLSRSWDAGVVQLLHRSRLVQVPLPTNMPEIGYSMQDENLEFADGVMLLRIAAQPFQTGQQQKLRYLHA